jgi:putative MATE family efflux protein
MKDLTKGHEGKLIFLFALPMLFGSVFQQLYNVVDSIIVGRVLGKEALAAVGNAFPIFFTLIALIIGVAFGGTVVISQYFGAKNYEKVRKAIGTLYTLMFGMAAFLTLIGLLFTDSILSLLKIPDELYADASIYIKIFIGGLIAFFGFNGTAAILRGLGDSKTPMVFMLISTFVNIGLDLLFVMVFKWGVAGVAIATVISQGGAFLTAVWYLNRYHKFISIRLKDLTFDKEIFLQTIRIGLPTGLQQTFVALGMIALQRVVNTFGTDVIASYSVAGRIDAIVMMPAMIFSQALAAFVGQNIGAGKNDRVVKGLHATLIMSSVLALILTLFIILSREALVGLFNQDPEVIRIGSEYLLIVSGCYLLFAGMFSYNGVMRGAGDTIIPMFITLFALWVVRIPAAYYLSGIIGETGIWWSVPIGWVAGLILSIFYYKTGRWKTKTVVKPIIDPILVEPSIDK